jgi:3-hydroxyisobutyrate dehydrogenase
VPAAKAASLTFMVGGKEKELEAIKDLLLCMGKNVVHCGDVGSGVTAKICNNMMLAISMIGTSETLNLGKRLGLDPKLLTKILNISSGRTWSSEVYNPVPGVGDNLNLPANNDYEGGFMTHLIAKDLGLAQSAATRSNSPTPLGTLSHQIYRLMLNNGYSTKDFSSVYKFIQQNEDKDKFKN